MAHVRTRGAVLVVLAVAAATAGCYPGGFGPGDCTASPPTTITFNPPVTDAVVAGTFYFQGLRASAGTLLGMSHAIEPVNLPAGASVDASGVSWAVPAGLAGTTQPFRVRSDRDLCGDAAELAWTVRIDPP